MKINEYEVIKDELYDDGRILEKAPSLEAQLLNCKIPNYQDFHQPDNTYAGNQRQLLKVLDEMAKLIDNKTNKTDTIGDFEAEEARIVKYKEDTYIPFSIIFDDGQDLTAMVSNVGENDKTYKKNKVQFVYVWLLNNKNITKQLDKFDIDKSTLSSAIARIVDENSIKFKAKNPNVSKDLDTLKKEIDSIKIDISNVVYESETLENNINAKVEEKSNKDTNTEVPQGDKKLIEAIKENDIYKQVMKDSHNGTAYNSTNKGKYKANEILKLWNKVENKESVDGTVQGAMKFLLEGENIPVEKTNKQGYTSQSETIKKLDITNNKHLSKINEILIKLSNDMNKENDPEQRAKMEADEKLIDNMLEL